MQLLWKRYSRSGYAPPWFYVIIALGFLALAIWGGVRSDWSIMAIALAMIPVTLVGARLMRRLRTAAAESSRDIDSRRKDDDHG